MPADVPHLLPRYTRYMLLDTQPSTKSYHLLGQSYEDIIYKNNECGYCDCAVSACKIKVSGMLVLTSQVLVRK